MTRGDPGGLLIDLGMQFIQGGKHRLCRVVRRHIWLLPNPSGVRQSGKV
jgi:hypothetical protein